MKGTDISEAQLKSAADFIAVAQKREAIPRTKEGMLIIRYRDLVRLVAWYGAVRAAFVRSNTEVDAAIKTKIKERR